MKFKESKKTAPQMLDELRALRPEKNVLLKRYQERSEELMKKKAAKSEKKKPVKKGKC